MADNRRRRRLQRRRPPLPLVLILGLLLLVALTTIKRLAFTDPATESTLADHSMGLVETVLSQARSTQIPDSAFDPSAALIAGRTPVERTSGPPLATPVQVPRASRYNPIALNPDPELASRVLARLAGTTGKFGVAIKDLDTGRGMLIDPDGEYQAASLFKVPVMFEVFRQRELGVLSFDEVLTLSERHVAYDLGTLDRGVGDTIRLAEALERMITISDNSSAILLTDRVGAFNVNQDMRGIGLEHTRLIADDLVTSPADMLLILEMLARGEGVSPRASAEMVQVLARQRVNDRVPRLLPPEAIVAHKTGNLSGVVNDVGIVYGPDVAFVIAVLVDGTNDEAGAARATAEIASTAYEYFRGLRLGRDTTQFPTAGPTATFRQRPPTETPTESPTPTETEATATPTGVPSATSTATSSPTALATPTASATPSATASQILSGLPGPPRLAPVESPSAATASPTTTATTASFPSPRTLTPST